MSVRVLSKVWDGFPGGGSDLLAMLALADWSDDLGHCWPSIAAVSHKTRLSRSQAQRVLHGLIDTGHLTVVANENGGAPGATRQYRINLDSLTGRMGATGSANATGRTDAQEGSHGRTETGRTHATQTVIDPSLTVREGAQKRTTIPSCPVKQLVELYHVAMPDNPRVKVLSDARRKSIAARWKEAATLTCKPFGFTSMEAGIDAWRQFFEVCAESPFLTGRAQPQPGKPPFLADIDFLMSPSGFAKCLENKYHREAV